MNRDKFSLAFSRDFLNEQGELAYGDIGTGLLDGSPHLHYSFLEEYADPLTPEQIAAHDGIVIIYPHVNTHTFAHGAQRLTFIGRCGVGYDKVDTAACTQADVALINAPQAMQHPTASASLMFMLALAKKLPLLDKLVREGRWDKRGEVRNFELRGRTVGIVGLGFTGRELARLVAPFEVRVLAFSPHADEAQATALNVELVPLQALLQESDFICLHCRLNDETRGLIGEREFDLMKPTAHLINMARGPVVDHPALVEALKSKRIAGAGIDVYYEEPLPKDDPITQLDNVILSPHWASGTLDAFLYAGAANCQNMLKAAQGILPDNIVNREVVDRPGFQAKLARFRQG